MKEETKICPIMSGTPLLGPLGNVEDDGLVYCKEQECQLWINVPSPGGSRASGCSFELAPKMVNGLLML